MMGQKWKSICFTLNLKIIKENNKSISEKAKERQKTGCGREKCEIFCFFFQIPFQLNWAMISTCLRSVIFFSKDLSTLRMFSGPRFDLWWAKHVRSLLQLSNEWVSDLINITLSQENIANCQTQGDHLSRWQMHCQRKKVIELHNSTQYWVETFSRFFLSHSVK